MDFINYQNYFKVLTETTGYDFSGYSAESLISRLDSFICIEKIASPDELREKIFYDKLTQEMILGKLLIHSTEMFRDAVFFQSICNTIFPVLSAQQKISIWLAGCATGEDAYSLAILLDEMCLLDRCEIIATDINEIDLTKAKSGIYPLQRMKDSALRYFRSGGKNNLSKYYTAYYDHVVFNKNLRNSIKFVKHDIISDKPVSRFHLILCRNVCIYFSLTMQNKAMNSFTNNLYNYGYFVNGGPENISNLENYHLSTIDFKNKIYRKII